MQAPRRTKATDWLELDALLAQSSLRKTGRARLVSGRVEVLQVPNVWLWLLLGDCWTIDRCGAGHCCEIEKVPPDISLPSRVEHRTRTMHEYTHLLKLTVRP